MMQRWLVWSCVLLIGFGIGQFVTSRAAVAQEAAAAPAGGEPAVPAQPAAGGQPAGGQQPAGGGAGGGEVVTHRSSWDTLKWIIVTSGWIGAFLLVLSIYFVSTAGRLFSELRPNKVMPPEILDQCATLLEKRDLKGLYGAVKEDGSEYSRLVRSGIAELPNGISEVRGAMERSYEVIHSEGERKISMLAVLGTLGPMIGLLGTLKGMIGAFGEIAQSEGGQMKASAVAGEISEALLLTFEGVLLSVPAIFLHAVFRNKITALNEEAFAKGEELVTKVFNLAKRPSSSASAPPPAPPSA